MWSLDKCHFYQHGTTLALWIPHEDKDPAVLQYPANKGISVFGAVNIKTGEFAGMMSSMFNTTTFLRFLVVLVKRRKRMQIILDNAGYHQAKLILPWLEKHKDLLFLDYLPPYFPELNPIERVLKLITKLRLHNQYFHDLKGIIKVVAKQFLLWIKENEILKTLCHI